MDKFPVKFTKPALACKKTKNKTKKKKNKTKNPPKLPTPF